MEERNKLYRHIGYLCKQAGLDREDRLSLARDLFQNADSITSYSDLESEDLQDIVFVLSAWQTIQQLRLANGSLVAEARTVLERLENPSPYED